MNNRLKRRYLIRKLFKEVAKETVGKYSFLKLKIIDNRGHSTCRGFTDNQNRINIIILLGLRGVESRIKYGYPSDYYKSRPDRLNKYIVGNRHNSLRFILYHELRHAWQRINNKNRKNEYQKEFDADTWAIAHLKTRQTDQTIKPAQTKTETVLTSPIKWKTADYVDLYKAGYSTSKIAKIYGIKDPRSVRYYLTKAGISLRRRAE